MPVTFIDKSITVKTDTLKGASLALRRMCDDIVTESIPNTPKDTGDLRRSTFKQVLGLHATIEWRKRYAAAQEVGTTRGHVIRKYTTPGTGKKYAENAVKKVVKNAQRYFEEAL